MLKRQWESDRDRRLAAEFEYLREASERQLALSKIPDWGPFEEERDRDLVVEIARTNAKIEEIEAETYEAYLADARASEADERRKDRRIGLT